MTRAVDLDDDALAPFFDAIDAALQAEDPTAAAQAIARARAELGPDDARVDYYEGCLAFNEEGPTAAVGKLVRAVEMAPDFADAHYLLALVYEAMGDRAGMIRHFLRTHDLDAEAEAAAGPSQALLDYVEGCCERVMADMPDHIRDGMVEVPIVLESRPHRRLVEEGVDPRLLGMFEGAEHLQRADPSVETLGIDVIPRRVVLYVDNLLMEFEEVELEEQIEITLLHEVGHYFGLDEDGVAELGLE